MSKSIKEPRITYISFLECELRGYWSNRVSKGKSTADLWIAKKSGCSMWIIRQDSQRRGRIFHKGAQIILSGNIVRFNQKDVKEKHRTVKKGETLQSISAKEYGISSNWKSIASANGIESPRRVTPGSIIIMPPID